MGIMALLFILMVRSYKRKRRKKERRLNSSFQSTLRKIGKAVIGYHDQSINPVLPKEELMHGTRMGMDSHADTTCVNKHAYIESVVEGLTVDNGVGDRWDEGDGVGTVT